MNPPQEFLCPITMEIMMNPVVMSDGHTYERAAITQALARNPVSPMTRQPMSMNNARTNYALKSLINSWITQNNISKQSEDQESAPKYELEEKPQPQPQPQPIRHLELTEFSAKSFKNHLHIKITPTVIQSRLPLALIAMIDVSGSMWDNPCESVRGMEQINISRLELVQHALKTIIETLGDTDEIVFITFHSHASICLPPTQMNSAGKRTAIDVLETMNPNGGTNIWDALRLGLEEGKSYQGRGFNTVLLLFTDGEPNQNPPMGIIPTLRDALVGIKQTFTISTFGFGYSIDSDLMENIARLGHGIYGYCPDCTMVGTIFINFLAAALTTIVQQGELQIRTPHFQKIFDVILMNGSSRNFLVDINETDLSQIQISFSIPITGDQFNCNHIDLISIQQYSLHRCAFIDQIYRTKLIKLLSENLFSPEIGLQQTQLLFNELKEIQDRTPYLDSLMIDLINSHPNHGQIGKAFQSNYFTKWGKDYLRSHLRFHETEQCGNFKDESLQCYGGPKFVEYRTHANSIFLQIPFVAGRIHQNSQIAVPVNAAQFYDYDGGCFDGNAIVGLKNGTKRVRDLEKGDILKDGGIVECVLETWLNHPTAAVILNSVLFTPFHPIEIEGQWIFPKEIGEIVTIQLDSWFNLILEGDKVIELNGIRAITLGHGREEGVLKHPYFGTDIVVNALKKYPGWLNGKIRIPSPTKCQRDADGMIISLF
jgi:hypothetical protein